MVSVHGERAKWIGAVVAGVMCLVGEVTAQVTYDYSGNTFTNVTPPYTTGDRVTGFLTTPLPLPPNLVLQDVAAAVQDFSFQDGVQVRTPANSALCTAFVSTDSGGALIDWNISVREAPSPGAGNPQQFIDVSDTIDQVGMANAGATVCDTLVNLTGASNSGGGAWSDNAGGVASYSYQGQTFTQFTGLYTASDSVSGSLILTGTLPPSLPPADLSAFVLGFQFSDGVRTRSLADTAVCGLVLGTDASGSINQWGIFLRELPWPGVGQPQHFLDSGTAFDQAGIGEAGATACDTISIFTDSGSTMNPGTWTTGGTLAIPAMSPWSIALLVSVLLVTGAWMSGRKKGGPRS